MTKIAASILSADFANLQEDCTRLLQEGVDLLHIDVMDGHFVPNISYGAPVLQSLHQALPDAYYDVHLMISDPARYAADFAKAGADLITFHLEAVPDTAEEVIAASRLPAARWASASGRHPGGSCLPVSGRGGSDSGHERGARLRRQKFLPGTPRRLAVLDAERKRRGCSTVLEVDGGINAETGPACVQAGADWLVAGNSLFRAEDPAAVVRLLHGQA